MNKCSDARVRGVERFAGNICYFNSVLKFSVDSRTTLITFSTLCFWSMFPLELDRSRLIRERTGIRVPSGRAAGFRGRRFCIPADSMSHWSTQRLILLSRSTVLRTVCRVYIKGNQRAATSISESALSLLLLRWSRRIGASDFESAFDFVGSRDRRRRVHRLFGPGKNRPPSFPRSAVI